MTQPEFTSSIQSPVVKNSDARLVRVMDAGAIIEGYRTAYEIDVAKYFAGLDKVGVYECQATGYRFYLPFSLQGHESLYHQLEKFDWNYKEEKWEYARALQHIPGGSRILDVGCGRGAFVHLAEKFGHSASGLELNSSAARDARNAGLNVLIETIGAHAARNTEQYDAVCSFQVLEHISNVQEFIDDCMLALRPEGILIFGVPNNDSFLRFDDSAVLNAPPHHMGLWSAKSLSLLSHAFRLELKALELEPLAELEWYASVMERRYLNARWFRAVYFRLGLSHLWRYYVRMRAYNIPGHTILAVYQKRNPKNSPKVIV